MSERTPLTVQAQPVQAMQFIRPFTETAQWCNGSIVVDHTGEPVYMSVPNPGHGAIAVEVGQWVIKNTDGTVTSLDDAQFWATFQPVAQ